MLEQVVGPLVVWLGLLGSLVLLKLLLQRPCDYSQYENRIRELKEQLREQKEHYEMIIRDIGIKSVMMQALWDAFTAGELQKCIREGGSPRVLADGAVICDKGSQSYLILSKAEGEEYAQPS